MNIQTKVKNTLKKIKLNKKEKIVVALSGGKDSTLTAYFLKKFGYNIKGFHIGLGLGDYSKKCLKAVKKLCDDLKIKLVVYDFKKEHGSSMCFLRTTIQSRKSLKNCAICGVIKKWILNKQARRLKASKIATGHNLDDEAQTFLMNILKGCPELSSNTGIISKNISDKKFIPRIKPLFYVPEDEIRKFTKTKKLPVVYEKCPCRGESYRVETINFLKDFSEKDKKNLVKNIMAISKKEIKEEMIYCEICGEPARGRVCKRCELLRR